MACCSPRELAQFWAPFNANANVFRIKSGPNGYSTAAYNNVTGVGVQDEMMRGKLSENQLFISLRKDF